MTSTPPGCLVTTDLAMDSYMYNGHSGSLTSLMGQIMGRYVLVASCSSISFIALLHIDSKMCRVSDKKCRNIDTVLKHILSSTFDKF